MTDTSQPVTIDQLERFYHDECVPPEEAARIVGVGLTCFYSLIKDAVEDGRIRRVAPGNKCVLYVKREIEELAMQRHKAKVIAKAERAAARKAAAAAAKVSA